MLRVTGQTITMMMRIIVLTGVITMQINWYWLIAVLVPYSIKRRRKKNGQIVAIKAIFWQLTLRQKNGQSSWNVHIPFIEHLRIVLAGVITMQINWCWLIAVLVPYSIKRRRKKNGQIVTIKAIFWQLTLRQKDGQSSWSVHILFIEHLRQR
jgi:hypothetical protein